MEKPPVRQWDWTAAGLLFLLLQVAAARLVTTDWAAFLSFTAALASFGTVLGLMLGVSRFGRRAVFWLASVYTALVVPWRIAGAFHEELLLDRLAHEGETLAVALGQFLRRQPVTDPLLFVLFACLAFWLIALMGGYWLTRYRSVLPSIFLGGAAIVAVQAYSDYQPRGSWWLAVYLMFALLLVGRVHYLNYQEDWSRRRVFVNEESWPNILGSVFVVAAVAILLAWLLPTSRASMQAAADIWKNVSSPIRERLSNAVTSLRGPYAKPTANFYGGTLALGRNAAAGDSVVLRIQALQSPGPGVRFYWRGRVYDDYQGGQWSASADTTVSFRPEQGDLDIPNSSGRLETLLGITSEFPTQSLMYGPAPTVWIDRTAFVPAVSADQNVYDAFSWESRSAIASGGTYAVKAELLDPTEARLRAAGEDYPRWVTDHDLEVPVALREELRQLSEAAVAGKDNPYDKAAAITSYLRANLQYSTSVPLAPAGQDPILWVLRSYKKGFCNYYASAEVLMLRSIGIPARLAVGFAHGELEGDTYLVYRRDAHAWPEVYFPGVGWVEFEPTVNQDPLVRPSGTVQTGGTTANTPVNRPQVREEGASPVPALSSKPGGLGALAQTLGLRWLILVVPILSGALMIALAHGLGLWQRLPIYLSRTFEGSSAPPPRWIVRWRLWNQTGAIERAFASINWSLALMRRPQPVAATPAERARLLSDFLPAASAEIWLLEHELESALYMQGVPDMARARRAAVLILIRSLGWRIQGLLGASQGRDVESPRSP
jgi:transglutaminase-like putative cysteine protease